MIQSTKDSELFDHIPEPDFSRYTGRSKSVGITEAQRRVEALPHIIELNWQIFRDLRLPLPIPQIRLFGSVTAEMANLKAILILLLWLTILDQIT